MRGATLRLFGRLQLAHDTLGDLLPRTRKARAVLAVLAMARGKPVRRTRIAGLLWDRVPEEQARNSLRQALSELTSAMRPLGVSLIEAQREDIRLRPEFCPSDLLALETALDEVVLAPSSADADRVAEAGIAWPQAPLLEDLDDISPSFDQWLAAERAWVENWLRERLEAEIERLCRVDAAPVRRIAAARDLLARDAAHERAWRLIIRSHADMGDTGQALREYLACEAALKRLLDAAPSAETRALRDQLRGAAAPPVSAGPRVPAAPRPAAPAPVAAPAMALADKVQPSMVLSARQASIAVLPFSVPAGNEEAMLVANGVVEGVIHALSGLGDLFVIGRGTSMSYAGGYQDPRAVGAALGVRYLVQGSVAGSGKRLRIFSELTETEGGGVVRSDRHDAAMADLFELQDIMTAEIVAAIAPSVRAQELERARRKPPASLTAYDLMLRGLDLMLRLEPLSFAESRRMFERAMAADPGFGAVRSHSANWYNYHVGQGWSADIAADQATAARLSAEALLREHNDAVALAIQGQTMSFMRRDYNAGRHFLDRAIAVGPSVPLAWAMSSATLCWTGDAAGCIEHAERALRLSPQDPFAFFAEHMVSQGHYIAGNPEEAVRWGRRSDMRKPSNASNLRTLAAALVLAGNIEAARDVAARHLAIQPGFSVREWQARTPMGPGLREPFGERLRLAGMPA